MTPRIERCTDGKQHVWIGRFYGDRRCARCRRWYADLIDEGRARSDSTTGDERR